MNKLLFNRALSTKMIMEFTGLVTKGTEVGAKFGIATANLSLKIKPELKEGVYIVSVNDALEGVLHFGERKTFGAGFSAEVHILNLNEDLYGQELKVTVLKPLRNIDTFENADALFTQIELDVLRTQKYFLRKKIHQKWKKINHQTKLTLAETAYNKVVTMPEFQSAKVIYAYAPDNFEIPFVEKLCKEHSEKTWYFPRIISGKMTFHPIDKYSDLEPGYLDLLEPPIDQVRTCPSPDLVLVPAVAGSSDRKRLGRGGGFYDQFLKHNWAPTVCILPDFAVQEEIPCEKHDQSIDKIIKI